MLLTIKTVCKILRNFTLPMLSKIEITIDFNGPVGQFYHSNAQIENSEFFSNFIVTIIVDNLHHNLFYSVMNVHQY